MRYSRLHLPIQAYLFFFGVVIIVLLIESLGILFLWIGIGLLLIGVAFYLIWNRYRWQNIEQLNQGLKISKKTAYIDNKGYLRWRTTDKLCHREIAWENRIRGSGKFGECDIHHIDENKFNNQPTNLEVLTREQHQFEHKQIIKINGQRYHKLASIHKIYRTTDKAYLIVHKWIPKSQAIHRDGYVYIPEWLYHKKGFG